MGVTIERADGTEEVLETVPSYETSAKEVHKDSGMYGILEDYLKTPPAEEKKEDNPKVDTEDETKLEDKENETEKKEEAGGGTEDTKHDEEDKGKEGEEVSKAEAEYDALEKPELLVQFKQSRDTVAELNNKIKDFETKATTLQSQLDALSKEKTPEAITENKEFVEAIRKDFQGGWNKFKEKFGLPDFDLIQSQLNGGGRTARLKQYLETTVKPTIEKEFGLEEGEFKFDISEAEEDPTSASARFLQMKREKETEFDNEVKKVQERESAVVEKIKDQQGQDLKRYADEFLEGDVTKANELLAELEKVSNAVALGKEPLEKHPFSIYKVLLGQNHEALVKKAVETERESIKQQLKDLGVVIPDSLKDKLPTNLKDVKVKTEDKEKKFVKTNKFSPMLDSIEQSIN